MKPKKIVTEKEARDSMIEGVRAVATAVGSTLGPGGRLVILHRDFGPVRPTKDGVTVAEELVFDNPFKNSGAQLCKQVARRCNIEGGDGTTSATVLAAALINECLPLADKRSSFLQIQAGMRLAKDKANEYIESLTQEIERTEQDIKWVATISGNSEEVGQTVADAFVAVGDYGTVAYEVSSYIKDTKIDIKDGTTIERGYTHPNFVNKPQQACVHFNKNEGVYVLITDKTISDPLELQPLLYDYIDSFKGQNIANSSLLIIADDVTAEALQSLLFNLEHFSYPVEGDKQRVGRLSVAVIKAPGWGDRRMDILEDLAKSTGGTFFNTRTGLKLSEAKLSQLGRCAEAVIKSDSTVLTGCKGEIAEHLEYLKKLLEEAEHRDDIERLEERIAKLAGKVATIKIGGSNETEVAELRDRYQDAICAVKAALEAGVVPGGGSALLGAAKLISKLKLKVADSNVVLGMEVVENAFKQLASKIADNAGYVGAAVVEQVLAKIEKNPTYGFDARTGTYGDMFLAGIVDPTKVTKLVLNNSYSIANIAFQTGVIIADDPDAKVEQPQYSSY